MNYSLLQHVSHHPCPTSTLLGTFSLWKVCSTMSSVQVIWDWHGQLCRQIKPLCFSTWQHPAHLVFFGWMLRMDWRYLQWQVVVLWETKKIEVLKWRVKRHVKHVHYLWNQNMFFQTTYGGLVWIISVFISSSGLQKRLSSKSNKMWGRLKRKWVNSQATDRTQCDHWDADSLNSG